MAKYQMRFFYDWGSGMCLWANNEETEKKYDYPIECEMLPISDDLKEQLEKLIYLHDEALNWNNPAGDLLWNQKQIDEFVEAAKKAYNKLCDELGEDYAIIFEDNLIM